MGLSLRWAQSGHLRTSVGSDNIDSPGRLGFCAFLPRWFVDPLQKCLPVIAYRVVGPASFVGHTMQHVDS